MGFGVRRFRGGGGVGDLSSPGGDNGVGGALNEELETKHREIEPPHSI